MERRNFIKDSLLAIGEWMLGGAAFFRYTKEQEVKDDFRLQPLKPYIKEQLC